jgi:hypothetical protein
VRDEVAESPCLRGAALVLCGISRFIGTPKNKIAENPRYIDLTTNGMQSSTATVQSFDTEDTGDTEGSNTLSLDTKDSFQYPLEGYTKDTKENTQTRVTRISSPVSRHLHKSFDTEDTEDTEGSNGKVTLTPFILNHCTDLIYSFPARLTQKEFHVLV